LGYQWKGEVSPTSAGIASSAHPMTTYILTNHPRHLHVITSP
jgi:hypothetical protein